MTAGPAGLRQYLRPRPTEPALERCELCATEVTAQHSHLVDVVGRTLRCACRPCALLFVDRPREMAGTADPTRPVAPLATLRTVPDRYLRDPGFSLSDEQWDALQIPVGMAFFLRSSIRQDAILACYPSPAGATESELDLVRFHDGVGGGRLGAELETDVEALLVRHDSAAEECLLVPIDACYRLVGLVRTHWRGFDGGLEAWSHIDGFFDATRARARTVEGAPPSSAEGPWPGTRHADARPGAVGLEGSR